MAINYGKGKNDSDYDLPKTPKNESQKGLQSLADVLQHPVV